ncbi:hypothetical protein FH608_006970 [Nonomuraea phyllanthi]|uniref:Peptidase M15A C-terminal domain-containing protein n=1 Tax=Nonomuraea phyllanthi TaxID=2219224 RepID=A0A5C4WTD7_9ACTN|nr:hypothetical protein [Nonomuraea phyllanthi]KAB8196475.1 hypothetical protein FH608_006970 [Nonomuraea phyllanthi]
MRLIVVALLGIEITIIALASAASAAAHPVGPVVPGESHPADHEGGPRLARVLAYEPLAATGERLAALPKPLISEATALLDHPASVARVPDTNKSGTRETGESAMTAGTALTDAGDSRGGTRDRPADIPGAGVSDPGLSDDAWDALLMEQLAMPDWPLDEHAKARRRARLDWPGERATRWEPATDSRRRPSPELHWRPYPEFHWRTSPEFHWGPSPESESRRAKRHVHTHVARMPKVKAHKHDRVDLKRVLPRRGTMTMSHATAARWLKISGVKTRSSGHCTSKHLHHCTSLDSVRVGTISRIIELKRESGCPIMVTGGTEEGHAPGTYSHGNGYKLDISHNKCIDRYITKNHENAGVRSDGARLFRAGSGSPFAGTTFADESSHWDILFR